MLNKICCLITHNPQIIFIITSIAINGSIFYLIFKYSKNPLLSIVIYFIGAYYFESMNIIRQYLGVSILLFAFPLIKEKKYIKVLILCTIAYFIHNASIVLSLTYILLFIYNKIYPKSYIIKKCDNAYLVLIGILIIIILHKYIYYGITFALSIASDKYFAYVGSKYDYSDLQITPLISGIIIYIYIYFAKRRMLEGNTKESEKYYDDYFIIIQTIDLIFIAMTSINILFLRISYMFGIFQIFSIPYYYEKYYKYHKRNILIYITLFIMFTSFIWINIVNKVEEALPYQTVFNIKSDGEKNE